VEGFNHLPTDIKRFDVKRDPQQRRSTCHFLHHHHHHQQQQHIGRFNMAEITELLLGRQQTEM